MMPGSAEKFLLPPNDPDSEMAVIGSLLLRGCDIEPPQAVLAKVGPLQPSDFFREANGWIFRAIQELARASQGIDHILVAHALSEAGKLEACGGAAYLLHCEAMAVTSYHLKYYAGIVLDCSKRRQQMAEGARMVREAWEGKRPPKPLALPPIKKG